MICLKILQACDVEMSPAGDIFVRLIVIRPLYRSSAPTSGLVSGPARTLPVLSPGVLISDPIFPCWKSGQLAIHQWDVTVPRLLVWALLWRNQGHWGSQAGQHLLILLALHLGWDKILPNKEIAGMWGGSGLMKGIWFAYDDEDQIWSIKKRLKTQSNTHWTKLNGKIKLFATLSGILRAKC